MREAYIALAYFLGWTCGCALLTANLFILMPLYDWLLAWLTSGFDAVRASVAFDMARTPKPYSDMAVGAVLGFIFFIITLGARIFNGSWPHER